MTRTPYPKLRPKRRWQIRPESPLEYTLAYGVIAALWLLGVVVAFHPIR